MKFIKYIILPLMVVTLIASCKKGDEDPFFSLKTREARMKGEWELVNIEGEYTNQDGLKYTYSYENGAIIKTAPDGEVDKDGQQINFTFGKKKSAQIVWFYWDAEDDSGEYDRITIDGAFSFIDKNKDADLKKKEAFLFHFQNLKEENEAGDSFTGTVENSDWGLKFPIIRLTNKEMKLDASYSITYMDSHNNGQNTNSGKYNDRQIWTFKKK
jgi:hypothetical protein